MELTDLELEKVTGGIKKLGALLGGGGGAANPAPVSSPAPAPAAASSSCPTC